MRPHRVCAQVGVAMTYTIRYTCDACGKDIIDQCRHEIRVLIRNEANTGYLVNEAVHACSDVCAAALLRASAHALDPVKTQ